MLLHCGPCVHIWQNLTDKKPFKTTHLLHTAGQQHNYVYNSVELYSTHGSVFSCINKLAFNG